MSLLRLAGLSLLIVAAGAAELTVGPGKMYAKPSLAAAAAHDGDTISIDAGTYTGDVCAWTQSNLTLRGVGGRAHLAAAGAYAWGKGTWVLAGANTTVENIEFSGSAVPDWNGAGIRLDGAGLTVRNCYFHDNENGILTAAGATSDVLIEHSEFARNGHGDGYSHNLYIGNVRSLVFRYNYSHHAKVGHNLKSRAQSNTLIGNRIMDEATGTSSYVVDIPNGGLTFLIGNLIQQGPASSNRSAIIRYGEEGGSNPVQRLYVVNNTIVNDYTGGGSTTFLTIAATTTVARVENNIFLGQGTAISGTATSNLHNLVTTTDPLLGRATYDYRLAAGSAAIDAAADPGSADGQTLLPVVQYVHPQTTEARATTGVAPDIGAYEAAGAANQPPVVSAAAAVPATVDATTTVLTATATDDGGESALTYSWTATGPAAVAFSVNGSHAAATTTATFTRAGSYTLTVSVRDAGSLTDSAEVPVTVAATPTAMVVGPASGHVAIGAGLAFTAVCQDQFARALAAQPALTWAVAGGGTIDGTGHFTAGAVAGGPYQVTATAGSVVGTAVVTVDPAGGGSSSGGGSASGGGCGSGGASLLLGLALTVGALRGGRRSRRSR